jgi:glutamate--cysteine ligase
MSTRVSGPESPVISSRDELVAYLEAGSKPDGDWRIGTEHEKFGFYRQGHGPVPYDGQRGIRALLEGLHDRFGWDPVIEDGNVIALSRRDCPKGGTVSLEPGGQLELSGAPLATLHETYEELRQTSPRWARSAASWASAFSASASRQNGRSPRRR